MAQPGQGIVDLNPENPLLAPPVPAASLSEMMSPYLNIKPPGYDASAVMARARMRAEQSNPGELTSALPAYSPSAPSRIDAAAASGVTPQMSPFEASTATDLARRQLTGGIATLGQGPGVLERLGNYFGGNQASAAALDTRAKAAALYSRPEAQTYFSAHPDFLRAAQADPIGFATKLGPVIDAAVSASGGPGTITHKGVGPNGEDVVVPVDNHARIAAMSAATGMNPRHVHGALESHNYTDADQWVNSMRGISRDDLAQMWQMQHYLNPQQQAMVTALNNAQAQVKSGKASTPQQTWLQHLFILAGLGGNAPLVGEEPTQ